MHTQPSQPRIQQTTTKPLTLEQALLLQPKDKLTFSLDPYKNDLRDSFERHFAKIGLLHNHNYTLTATQIYARFPKELTPAKQQIYELMLKVKDNNNKEIELSYRWFRV